MCKNFECKHNHNGICSYSDKECEYEKCDSWSDCSECGFGNYCYDLDL